jgi:O-antigen/teichoic acid export membrane protein
MLQGIGLPGQAFRRIKVSGCGADPGDAMQQVSGSAADTTRDLVRVVLAKALSAGALFATGVLVARVAGPAEYGLYTAALSLVLLIDGVVGSPFDVAAVRFGSQHADDPARVERLLGGTFRAKLAIGLALAIVAGWAPALIFSDPERTGLLRLALASTLGLLALRSTAVALQVRLRFQAYARLDVLLALGRMLAVAALWLAGVRSAEPYLGSYGAMALAVFAWTLFAVPQPFLRHGLPEPRDRGRIAAFAGITGATGALGTVTGRADALVLASFRPSAELGLYAAGAQITAVLSLLAAYAGVVFQPRILPWAQRGRTRSILALALAGGALVGVTAAGVGIALAPWLVERLYGAEYHEGATILRVLLIGAGIDFLGLPILMHMAVQLHPRAAFAGELLTLGVFAVAAPLATVEAGALGIAWTGVGIRLVKLAVYLAAVLRGSKARPLLASP